MRPADFLVDGAAPGGNVPKPDLRDYMEARHIVSVMDPDYGVVGDGVADDAAGINLAGAALITGGILWFPKGTYHVEPTSGNTCCTMPTSAAMWRGEGSADYQIGAPVTITTDVDAADVLVITDRHCPQVIGIAILNETAGTATGTGIKITNSQNGRLDDVAIRGFNKDVEFNPGANAPHSCFGWSIVDCEFLDARNYAIDAQASTNALTIIHTTLGSDQVALRFKDSVSLVTQNVDIEGAGNVGIEIDLSSQGDVSAKLNVHFEFGGAVPTGGCVRLGNTARVWGVDLDTCIFAGSGLITVNAANGSSFTHHGCSVHGSIAAGDVMTSAAGSIASPDGAAFTVRSNTASANAENLLPFAQKNAASKWTDFVRVVQVATSVVDGNEQSQFKVQLRTNGTFQDAFTLTYDGNGVLSGRFDGYLQIKDNVTAPSTAAGYVSLYADAADGDLKARFGDATVKTIVADT
jgi:hypothetical protein